MRACVRAYVRVCMHACVRSCQAVGVGRFVLKIGGRLASEIGVTWEIGLNNS